MHFLTYVCMNDYGNYDTIIKSADKQQQLRNAIEELMDDFNELTVVDEYEEPCDCIDQDQQADKDCKECWGSGIMKTASNPNGHLDWFVIGGRWDGHITRLQALKTAGSEGGFNFGDEFHGLERNIVPVTGLRSVLNEELLPHAIVDSAGKWIETENSWGDKDYDEWMKQVLEILSGEPADGVVIACDCHV